MATMTPEKDATLSVWYRWCDLALFIRSATSLNIAHIVSVSVVDEVFDLAVRRGLARFEVARNA
jgi:hypothetical protein